MLSQPAVRAAEYQDYSGTGIIVCLGINDGLIKAVLSHLPIQVQYRSRSVGLLDQRIWLARCRSFDRFRCLPGCPSERFIGPEMWAGDRLWMEDTEDHPRVF